jgi:hypothetical protein
MAPYGRRRILVALEPMVLEGAFAALLGDGERSDVVQFHRTAPENLANHYDVAIVTSGLLSDLVPDVLITLPDTQAGGGEASVTVDGVTRSVSARTNQDVIDLISEQFPQEIYRSA